MKLLKTLVVYVLLITLGGCISATKFTEEDWNRLEIMMDKNGNLTEEYKEIIRSEIEAGTMSQEEIDKYKDMLAEDAQAIIDEASGYLPPGFGGPVAGIAGTLAALFLKRKGGSLVQKIKDAPPGQIVA